APRLPDGTTPGHRSESEQRTPEWAAPQRPIVAAEQQLAELAGLVPGARLYFHRPARLGVEVNCLEGAECCCQQSAGDETKRSRCPASCGQAAYGQAADGWAAHRRASSEPSQLSRGSTV